MHHIIGVVKGLEIVSQHVMPGIELFGEMFHKSTAPFTSLTEREVGKVQIWGFPVKPFYQMQQDLQCFSGSQQQKQEKNMI